MARERLGELLIRAGVLTQAQLVAALREQARTGVRLGQILVDHDMVEEVTLYDAVAKVAGLERFNLRTAILEKSTLAQVSADWASEHGVAPYRMDVQARTVHVALTDPTNVGPVDELGFRLGLRTRLFVASETELQRVLRHLFHGEALDRDARNVHRPGAPQRRADIAPEQIIRGIDRQRDELLGQAQPAPQEHATPRPVIPDALFDTGAMRALPEPPRTPPPDLGRFPELPRPAPRLRGPGAEGLAPEAPREPRGPAPAAGPGLSVDERAVLSRLKPVFDTQEEAARALRAIFELCVEKGIVRREEYLERLKRTPD